MPRIDIQILAVCRMFVNEAFSMALAPMSLLWLSGRATKPGTRKVLGSTPVGFYGSRVTLIIANR